MRIALASILVALAVLPAYGQKTYEIQQPKGTWQKPGEIRVPTGPWQKPGEIKVPTGTWQQPGPIQVPTAPWQKPGPIQQPTVTVQTPGPIQTPTGPWQQPGPIQVPKATWQEPGPMQVPTTPLQQPAEIQVPKGVEVVRATGCEQRLRVIGDALFDFDKYSLRPDAEEMLLAAGPAIATFGGKPARIEGHTDALGSDGYNLKLSEARATTVRNWLAKREILPDSTPIKGLGKTTPIAPNKTADGKDDPEGRQKNRRVEIVFDGCA